MIAALVAVAALVVPSGFHEVRALEPAASFVAKKHIVVACPNSAAVWAQFVDGRSAGGNTVIGGDAIRLSYGVCAWLMSSPDVHASAYAGSVVVLTHESIHARGESDEGATECSAMHEAPGVAVRFFHVRAGKQLRALMTAAWVAHSRAPAAYRAVC